MATIHDVNLSRLIEKAGMSLKNIKEMEMPSFGAYVKTGSSRERHPDNPDWWYIRAASILTKVYREGPIGVSKLRTKYGGKKNRGYKPERFYKGSGSIIRKILQQLEKAGLVEKGQVGVHKGKLITKKGESFLDKIAKEVK